LGYTPLQAHEFWFKPIASPQALGDTVSLRLEVGESFSGEAAGFSIPKTKSLRHITAKGQNELRPSLSPDDREAEVALSLDQPGVHLLAFDSAPDYITLSADKFHAYLHDEGLNFVKTQREQSGAADQPARERFVRNVKTLIQVDSGVGRGAPADTVFTTHTGQRLEILPINNPLSQTSGDELVLDILFDQGPLAGALVKAWHKQNGQLILIRATTSAVGRVKFNLPYAGDWMVSVVHMTRVIDDANIDWESFWGNLSFHLPQHRSDNQAHMPTVHRAITTAQRQCAGEGLGEAASTRN
jgi:hypothetical protein